MVLYCEGSFGLFAIIVTGKNIVIMIYIAVHKNSNLPVNKFYRPIVVGGNRLELNTNDYLFDNEGDNISNKNAYYSEITAFYYLYKNNYDEIIGFCHYRRYFIRSMIFYLVGGLRHSLLNKSYTDRILKSYDIIVPKKTNLKNSLWENYSSYHFEKDLSLTEIILERLYPDYLGSFNYVMRKQKFIHHFNMLVTKKNIFNEYSDWLFNILFELEKKIDTNGYSEYQMRVLGFLSERLFNVYLYHNKFKVKEVNVINTETTFKEYFSSVLMKFGLYYIFKNLYRRIIDLI